MNLARNVFNYGVDWVHFFMNPLYALRFLRQNQPPEDRQPWRALYSLTIHDIPFNAQDQMAVVPQTPGVSHPQRVHGWTRKRNQPPFAVRTYDTFFNFDAIGPDLRQYAPKDKPVSDEEADRLKEMGIEFGAKLGSGSYGHCWMATMTVGNVKMDTVAKRLAFADWQEKTTPGQTPEKAIEFMVREMRAYHYIKDKHPNIIDCFFIWRIYDQRSAFPDPISVVFFLEPCAMDLEALLETKQKLFTEDDGRKLFVQLGHAVDFIHNGLAQPEPQGKNIRICHYDIKPPNIFVKIEGDRGQFKLADFGIAKLFPGNKTPVDKGIRGTETTISPEMIIPKFKRFRYNPMKCDVFSTGATVLITWFGTGPVDPATGQNTHSDYIKMLDRFLKAQLTPDDYQAFQSQGVGHEAVNMMARCCHPNPDTRATMAQLLQDQWPQGWQYDGGHVQLDILG